MGEKTKICLTLARDNFELSLHGVYSPKPKKSRAMSSRMLLLFGIPVGMLVTWSLVSPYFIEERIDEPVPVTLPATGPTTLPATGSATLPLAQSESTPTNNPANMQAIMSEAAAQPDKPVFEAIPIMPPAMEIPSKGRTGIFSGADIVHRGSGNATIYHSGDGQRWLRLEDFRVTNGPDLVVYLTEHDDPDNAEKVIDGFVKLAQLKGNTGNQNYEIPDNLKLENYGAVVIWCELFGVLFATASLSEHEA